MSTMKFTAPAIRPQSVDDTHEGIQQALDLLHRRRAALGRMMDDAREQHDNRALFDLDCRHAEVCGLLSAMRGLLRGAA
jgi:hypothetical protein